MSNDNSKNEKIMLFAEELSTKNCKSEEKLREFIDSIWRLFLLVGKYPEGYTEIIHKKGEGINETIKKQTPVGVDAVVCHGFCDGMQLFESDRDNRQ
ncbi:MAG: hypothetical protein LUE23_05055 [Lachnospiraceae bacterium]|nr:hypothetical protein [Lachnospiraceae bacterium]